MNILIDGGGKKGGGSIMHLSIRATCFMVLICEVKRKNKTLLEFRYAHVKAVSFF